MRYLMENEMGFDTQELGFPSIHGCHAIVYQTGAGLYGYHSFGGSEKARWQPRANYFRDFIMSLNGLGAPGTRLYGCSSITHNDRGYKLPVRASWQSELVDFATALNYSGKISGYDLCKTVAKGSSAYVEYHANGSKCDIQVRTWTEKGAPPRAANSDRARHKLLQAKGFNLAIVELDTVVTMVDRNSLFKISKEKLR